MAHPLMTRKPVGRAAALAVVAGATLLLPAGSASAQMLPDAADTVPCEATELLEEVCGIIDETVGSVEESAAPVTDPLAEAVAPVVEAVDPALEALPTDEVPLADSPTDDEEAPAEQAPAPSSASSSGSSSSTSSSNSATSEPAKVEAAGKNTTEVVEPQAPSADGRVAAGPTIQPTDLGSNIPGVRSQSGLNLQPYEPPVVSVPMEYEAPEVASPVTTTAAPVQEAAAELVRFTGETLVPYTSGAGAWITATGLGLLGVAGYAMRRRFDNLTATTLD